jgi:hypothetical protein
VRSAGQYVLFKQPHRPVPTLQALFVLHVEPALQKQYWLVVSQVLVAEHWLEAVQVVWHQPLSPLHPSGLHTEELAVALQSGMHTPLPGVLVLHT